MRYWMKMGRFEGHNREGTGWRLVCCCVEGVSVAAEVEGCDVAVGGGLMLSAWIETLLRVFSKILREREYAMPCDMFAEAMVWCELVALRL